PVKKGEQVGEVRLILAGEEIGRVPLVTAAAAERSELLYLLDKAEDIMLSFWFKFAVLFVAVFTVLYLILMVTRNRAKRRREQGFTRTRR
ncbi:MAG: D-alanyl-D-alanine carboxypeptidase, partial [Hydrogenoanaerobacterium sp.]